MEAQFNFQIKQKKDKRGWEDIEVYYLTECDRTQQYDMQERFPRSLNQKSD